MPTFQGKPSKGILQFPKAVEEKRTELLRKYEDRWVSEDLKLIRPLRTSQQIKCHFGLLINSVIAKANDEGIDTSTFLRMMIRDDLPTGVDLTKEFLHELFYGLCPLTDKNGKRARLSRMTTDQASLWLKQCMNLLASRGIYIDDPDPAWKEKP